MLPFPAGRGRFRSSEPAGSDLNDHMASALPPTACNQTYTFFHIPCVIIQYPYSLSCVSSCCLSPSLRRQESHGECPKSRRANQTTGAEGVTDVTRLTKYNGSYYRIYTAGCCTDIISSCEQLGYQTLSRDSSFTAICSKFKVII